jgi:hypothetical protein
VNAKIIAAAVAYFAWAAFIIVWSGSFAISDTRWSIEQFGQFGDAFGALNAVMVSLAAYFTWQALQHDRQQSSRTSAEQTFFRLLDTRSKLLNEIEFNSVYGVEAIAEMRRDILEDEITDIIPYYATVHRDASNVLHTYYRITYHALSLIRDRFDRDGAYRFAQILRAELSSPEQFLIGLNAAWQYPKMLALVERFSLLHTMPEHDWALLKTLFPNIDESAWSSESKRDGAPD